MFHFHPPSPHPHLSLPPTAQDRIHRRAIPLTNMNVILQGPGLDYHRYAMLIVFRDEEDKTRNLYIYAENGKVCLS